MTNIINSMFRFEALVVGTLMPIFKRKGPSTDLMRSIAGSRFSQSSLATNTLLMLWVLIRSEVLLMGTHNMFFYRELEEIILELSPSTLAPLYQ